MPTATKTKPATRPAKPVKATGRNGKSAAAEKSPVQGRDDMASGGFTFPARLVSGAQEKHEGTGDWRLNMIFERLDRQWDDGNPVRAYVSLFTTYKGEPVWEGSDADTVSASFLEQTSEELDILSDDSIENFISHSFMLSDEDTGREYVDKKGRTRKAYLTTCIEYLGDEDYEYDGKVTTVQGTGGGTAAEAFDAAAYLASIFDGQEIADLRAGGAMDIVKADDQLAEVKSVLDKPLRGGLVKPKAVLIDKLIEGGYAIDEGGIFVATPAD